MQLTSDTLFYSIWFSNVSLVAFLLGSGPQSGRSRTHAAEFRIGFRNLSWYLNFSSYYRGISGLKG